MSTPGRPSLSAAYIQRYAWQEIIIKQVFSETAGMKRKLRLVDINLYLSKSKYRGFFIDERQSEYLDLL